MLNFDFQLPSGVALWWAGGGAAGEAPLRHIGHVGGHQAAHPPRTLCVKKMFVSPAENKLKCPISVNFKSVHQRRKHKMEEAR